MDRRVQIGDGGERIEEMKERIGEWRERDRRGEERRVAREAHRDERGLRYGADSQGG